ncbi:hypothetical protein P3T37_006247 [Kitasatospora sp. MAA4]|uniref:hypothetical protein n=1 Tax=Kitasatospora sp. MAA4 TaxID=3035093 RepID=UPI00247537B5|nr:hypothetical protein [Kitasatospora sp. MAA4]MDH6136816.1 hypothetical protein [Kitasatospora sp. MAA4]
MLRSGRLLALDEDAVQLAAAGLVRLGVQRCGDKEAGATAWRIRASSFAHAWLDFGDPPGPELRVPAGAVLRSLVHRAAQLLLQVHDGHGPAVLEWLGLRAAEAGEQARWGQTAHPAEPTALALVWHGVQAVTAEGGHGHDRRIDDRCEAYVRERHHRQDTLALILACARLNATALTELSHQDPGRTGERLEEHASRHMPLDGPAPLWVPGRPRHSAR